MSKPPIPAEIRRAVLVEAGHRCAIPRCGQTELDIHHIVPWETCQKHEYSNLIALCPVCHRRAHNGEIDRKSLFIYKERLANEFGTTDASEFKAEVIEIRRRISEYESSPPGYRFEFDFPEFTKITERIVSRNIETWGHEFLVQFRELQEHNHQRQLKNSAPELGLFRAPSILAGNYQIVRRDDSVISVRYTIDSYYTGAAHGRRLTRVQNFLLNPFSPLTLQVLLGDTERLQSLANFLRETLSKTGTYDEEWLARGTEPRIANFERFNIEDQGVRFIFSEYQISCYAVGEQELWVAFNELAEIFHPAIVKRLMKSEL